MSPILIRPVREQLEHDRVIRLLLGKWRKKYEAAANPGDERNTPLKVKGAAFFPDLILAIPEGGKKSQAVVEVETSESLNHLEALAQWTNFSKAKGYFYLYVPTAGVDVARRLAEQHRVNISELWSYYQIGDQVKFLQVFKGKGTPELSMVDEEEPFKPVRPEPEPAEPVEVPIAKAALARVGAAKAAEPVQRAAGGKGASKAAATPQVAPKGPGVGVSAKAPTGKASAKASAAPIAAPAKKVAAKPAATASSSKGKGPSSKAKPTAKTVKPSKSPSARTSKPVASAKKPSVSARKAGPKAPQRSAKAARIPVAKVGARASKTAPKKPAAKAKSSRSRR